MPSGRRPQIARTQEITVAGWQAQMRTAFFEGVSQDDMRDVVQAIVAKAKAGDLSAAKILLTYGVGSPTVQVKNAVFMSPNDAPPLPTPPSKALPGSEQRIIDMSRRARAGKPVHDPRDRTYEDCE